MYTDCDAEMSALPDESGVIAEGASAAVLVADRYGQICDVVRAGASICCFPPANLSSGLGISARSVPNEAWRMNPVLATGREGFTIG